MQTYISLITIHRARRSKNCEGAEYLISCWGPWRFHSKPYRWEQKLMFSLVEIN